MIEFIQYCSEKPYSRLKKEYDKAKLFKQDLIQAISISSYSKINNEVDVRFVNLKMIKGKEFIFFTNYNSKKSEDFKMHNQIAASFLWPKTNTQIRMKATIKKVSSEFNQEYFLKRSKEKNALAISSNQSQVISSFEDVKTKFDQTLSSSDLKKCPTYWGGYSFIPFSFEFWKGHEYRLNKRDLYVLDENVWKKSTLEP